MEEKNVAAMEELGAVIERLHFARSKRSIKDEQKLFVVDGIDDYEGPRRNKQDPSDIKHNFLLGFVARVHVLEEHVWYVYRNGKFYKALKAGPHWLVNWDIFFARWQVRRINLRTVLLPAFAIGRVQGPPLPHHGDQAPNIDFALDVVADFRLLCKITEIKPFLRHESPIKTFYAYFNNMVREHIGDLPYDQYGKWASTLKTKLEQSLQRGPDNSEDFIGLQVEKVFVDSIASNREHDQQVLELYLLVEKGKRELEAALSMQRQGAILDISPAILALQNNEAGRTLLECDAELRKLMIAAGLRPGGMLPISSPSYVIEQQTPGSYLQSSRRPQLPPVVGASGPLPSVLPGIGTYGSATPPPDPASSTAPLTPPFTSQPLSQHFTPTPPLTPPFTPHTVSQPLTPDANHLLKQRQAQDIEMLRAANFHCLKWAQKNTSFDTLGQPLPDGMVWVLDVFVQRSNGHLVITFQCGIDYPQSPPTTRVRTSNSSLASELFPNTIVNWQPDCSLVDVVRDLENLPF
jgi:hypothetical protein